MVVEVELKDYVLPSGLLNVFPEARIIDPTLIMDPYLKYQWLREALGASTSKRIKYSVVLAKKTYL